MIIKPFDARAPFYCAVFHDSGRRILIDESGFPCSRETLIEMHAALSECISSWDEGEVLEICEEREKQEMEYKQRFPFFRIPGKKEPSGHVYLLRFDDGVYKIGRTVNLEERMGNYKSHSTTPPTLVCSIGTRSPSPLEAELHSRFASKRVEGREWFYLSDQDVDYIVNLSKKEES